MIPERSRDVWRTSSYSQPQGDCVELRGDLNAVRDSKNPNGPILLADLGALLAAVRNGQLNG